MGAEQSTGEAAPAAVATAGADGAAAETATRSVSSPAQSPQQVDVKSLPSFSRAEVAAHRDPTDCWLIIHGLVYDVTALLAEHPGGEELLLNVAGMDASADYDEAFHPDYVLQSDALQYLIGRVKKSRRAPGQDGASAPPPPSAPTTT